MYAIIETGGKQYRAEAGAILKLERLDGEVGDAVQFEQVLLVADGDEVEIGQPYVDGKPVQARIVEQGRRPKVIVYKYKKRKDYQKKQGHRQAFTAVQIETIGAPVEGETEVPVAEAACAG